MNNCTNPNTLFDHLLDVIESGRDNEALLILAGMLDAAQTDANRAASFRKALLAHPLSHFLTRQQSCNGAIAGLGGDQRFAAKIALGAAAVEAAWMRGKQILLYQCGCDGELYGIAGREIDNVSIEYDGAPLSDKKHDLILATKLADRFAPELLASQLGYLRQRLFPTGVVLIASSVPGHLGHALRQLCNDAPLHCHDESGLEQVARSAGFSISSFRDASNSLIWAELRIATEIRQQIGETA